MEPPLGITSPNGGSYCMPDPHAAGQEQSIYPRVEKSIYPVREESIYPVGRAEGLGTNPGSVG
jgi:hypothetical protein